MHVLTPWAMLVLCYQIEPHQAQASRAKTADRRSARLQACHFIPQQGCCASCPMGVSDVMAGTAASLPAGRSLLDKRDRIWPLALDDQGCPGFLLGSCPVLFPHAVWACWNRRKICSLHRERHFNPNYPEKVVRDHIGCSYLALRQVHTA